METNRSLEDRAEAAQKHSQTMQTMTKEYQSAVLAAEETKRSQGTLSDKVSLARAVSTLKAGQSKAIQAASKEAQTAFEGSNPLNITKELYKQYYGKGTSLEEATKLWMKEVDAYTKTLSTMYRVDEYDTLITELRSLETVGEGSVSGNNFFPDQTPPGE